METTIEKVEENVLDLVSFHSKYNKNAFETASIKKSVISSRLSKKDKDQINKELKKVNFFALKEENRVQNEDLDS